jgi:hypothetical protein
LQSLALSICHSAAIKKSHLLDGFLTEDLGSRIEANDEYSGQ